MGLRTEPESQHPDLADKEQVELCGGREAAGSAGDDDRAAVADGAKRVSERCLADRLQNRIDAMG